MIAVCLNHVISGLGLPSTRHSNWIVAPSGVCFGCNFSVNRGADTGSPGDGSKQLFYKLQTPIQNFNLKRLLTLKYRKLINLFMEFFLDIFSIFWLILKHLRWCPTFLFSKMFLYKPPIWIVAFCGKKLKYWKKLLIVWCALLQWQVSRPLQYHGG